LPSGLMAGEDANAAVLPVIGVAAGIGWSRSVMSQKRTVRSVLAATTVWPSGLNVTPLTIHCWRRT
jgi:hypothetical protein